MSWNKGKRYKNGPHKKKRRPRTDEEKQIVSKRFKGIPKSEEHKLKIKKALTNNEKNLKHLKNLKSKSFPWVDRLDFDITKIKNYQEGKEIYGHIYLTIFPNRKIYVGQCQRIINSNAEKCYFGSGVLYDNAEKYYGKENLKKIILYLCYDLEEYNREEERLIYVFKGCDRKRGYNILPCSANLKIGGINPVHLPGVKEKIRKACLGRIITEEQRLAMSIRQTGMLRNETTKKKDE